ncbi:MAG: selenocysteine-specific translation elongation factor [Myxococcota bacterium]|nr:selenocysteine-specific translation elongation factor [Myxococcota bacterium]
MAGQHLIVGTAGHIDHGKTSLVRALTGVDLDRLPEERERGITIALGFTSLALPDGRSAAFVDVPGHEKLVRTMIAGATGLDVVILVVAANEGVMPQTREHLAILSLLGVTRGFVALTKCDLVDDETRDFAELDIEETVAGTFLEGAPVVRTGLGESPFGLDEIRGHLADHVDSAANDAPDGRPFRLPIDRCFIQRGFGTVVTGTARGQDLKDGSAVWVQPLGIASRVRGLQVHSESVPSAQAGQRVAVNLAGVERDDLARGMVVVSDADLAPTSVMDVQITVLPDAPTIPSGGHVRLSLGTAEVLAVADPIGSEALDPGRTQWVQLRTESPIIALPGDRFVIRRESPLQTLGGGVVLDPWAPRARRKHHTAIAADLAALHAGDPSVILRRAGVAGLTPAQARLRGIDGGVNLGDRWIHPEWVERLDAHVVAALTAWHNAHPLAPGAPRRALHTGLAAALSPQGYDALIGHLCEAGRLAASGPTVRLPSFAVELNDAQQAARKAMIAELAQAGLQGAKFDDLIQKLDGLVQLLLDQGEAQRIGERVVGAEHLNGLVHDVRAFFTHTARLTPADFKTMTGQSRRTAIPLLEWLDSQGVTRRDGDARISA